MVLLRKSWSIGMGPGSIQSCFSADEACCTNFWCCFDQNVFLKYVDLLLLDSRICILDDVCKQHCLKIDWRISREVHHFKIFFGSYEED